MLCVPIAQQSQRLAIFDMFNAAPLCDLLEIRLDRFDKAPEFNVLFEKKFKPVIVACRRVADGGDWAGTEEARLVLLRQAILAHVDYVEIEVDVADEVRRYGPTKRVISYTNTREVPEDLGEIYRECLAKDPDVVKITVPTRTPEEAWPLIRIVAKATVPTVAVGWGRGGRLLNVLGQRYKAPWTYAALEKGMEAYPGMAPLRELDQVWRLREITSKTPLVGIAGPFEQQRLFGRLLNGGFEKADYKARCLPLDIGSIPLFQKVVDAIKLKGVLVSEPHRESVLKVLHEREEAVERAGACDFVAVRDEKWCGFAALPRAVVAAIEAAMLGRRPEEPPLAGKTFVIVGAGGTARGIAAALRRKNAAVVIADMSNEKAQRVAHDVGGRFIPSGQVYGIMCDGMILTRDPASDQVGVAAIPIPKSAAKPGLLAVDLTRIPYVTPFLDEIRVLEGLAVSPLEIAMRTAQVIVRAFSGRTLDLADLRATLDDWDEDFTVPPAPAGA